MRGDELIRPRRALVVTALAVEFSAIRARLIDVREEIHAQGTVYEIGDFTGPLCPRGKIFRTMVLNRRDIFDHCRVSYCFLWVYSDWMTF
jgi:hypothetical protein